LPPRIERKFPWRDCARTGPSNQRPAHYISIIPVFSPRAARIPPRRGRIRRDWSILLRRVGRWRKRARWCGFKLKAAPRALRLVVIATAIVVVFSAANLIFHVLRKPTELLSPVSGAFNKSPAETWRHYAPLFREYSTTSISPELLAALAQAEGAGNPVASTYWRWRLTWSPFAIYQPAASSVGMYQMTDAAFAEARRYCIRHPILSLRTAARHSGSTLAFYRAAPSSISRSDQCDEGEVPALSS